MAFHNTIKKSLLWDITRRCNLNCIHCYNSGNIASMQELEVGSNYKTIINRAVKVGINHIHLLGGEPLLARGIFELLQYAKLCGVLVSINTNGTLLTEDLINQLIAMQVCQLTISLDGANSITNDEVRGVGNFEKVIDNIKRTTSSIEQSASSMIVQVATVITRKNLLTIHKLPSLLNEIGVKHLDVLKLYECGNAINNESALCVTNEEYLNTISKILIESYRNQIYTQFDCKPKVLETISQRFGFQIDNSKLEYASCSAGKKIIFMDYKGNIYPCGPYAYEFPNTKLSTSIFADNYIDDLKAMEKEIAKRIKNNSNKMKSICINCHYENSCNGCAICYKSYEEMCKIADRLYLE